MISNLAEQDDYSKLLEQMQIFLGMGEAGEKLVEIENPERGGASEK